MPLLTGVPVTGRPVAWKFIHIAEERACHDDVGLLAQVGAWPPTGAQG